MITATISMAAAEAASDLLALHGHKEVADALFAITNDTACIDVAGHPVEEFDNAKAHQEGWGIFDCDGSTNGRWQICQIDCPAEWNEAYEEGAPERLPFEEPQFPGDGAVWEHVVKRALAGSQYHRNALTFIEIHNPKEWAAICQAHPAVKPRIRIPARRAA